MKLGHAIGILMLAGVLLAPESVGQPAGGKIKEESSFVFTPRGRRDPFIPPFSSAGASQAGRAGVKPEGTAEEMLEAARTVRDMEQALRDGNFPRFKIFYEKVNKLIDQRRWTNNALLINSYEVMRRASRLKRQMDMHEKVALYNTLLESAQALIPEMKNKLAAQNYDSVRANYQKVIEYLARIQVDANEPGFAGIIKRRNAIHKNATDIFTVSDQEQVVEILSKAEAIIGEMQKKLEANDFDSVFERYDKLRMQLAPPIPPGQVELKRARDRLMSKAGEIRKQAEIGKVKEVLAAVEAVLAQMEDALNRGDYEKLTALHDSVQEKLRGVTTSEGALLKARNALVSKAETLRRRAEIRREFVNPRIDGIAWAPINPGALVNGRAVGEGDSLDEKTSIKAIDKNHVVFTYKGEDIAVGIGVAAQPGD